MAKAKVTIKCERCGEYFSVEKTCRNSSDARSFEEWAEKNITVCDACREKERAQKAQLQREKERENGIPDLTGTEKQVNWAMDIRSSFMKVANSLIERIVEEEKEMVREIVDWIIKKNTVASWWIDNRYSTAEPEGVARLIRAGRTEYLKSKMDDTPAAEEAKKEALLMPETETKNAPATVSVDNADVTIKSEKNDSVAAVARALCFTWDSDKGVWRSDKGHFGSTEERAAEAANNLIIAGVPVIVWDAEVRRRAVAGEFRPLGRRLLSVDSGRGMFRAVWEYGADEIYSALRNIKGAKYERGGFYISLPHWREVLDVAESFGFYISNGALRAIENQKIIESEAMKVSPAVVEQAKGNGLKDILKSSDAVIEDLRDK